MHPARAPRFVEMRVGSLEKFAALAQQPPPAGPPNPSPVGIHRVARCALASPPPPAAVRLRHVAAEAQLGQRDQGLVAVVPLIRGHLGHASTRRQHGFDSLRRGGQRLDHRRRVACTGILHGDADHGARLQVDRVLGLVGQVRPAVLHLRGLRVRVLRMRPILSWSPSSAASGRGAPARRGSASECWTPPPIRAGTCRSLRPYPGGGCSAAPRSLAHSGEIDHPFRRETDRQFRRNPITCRSEATRPGSWLRVVAPG